MSTLSRPFPALTPTQRLHLDVYGYVIIERTISPQLAGRLAAKTYEIEEKFRRDGALREGAAFLRSSSREYFRIDNLPHVDPCYLEYLTHPHLLGMAEEAIGSEARLEQSDAHIRRAPPADKTTQKYQFHRGAGERMTWRDSQSGLFHCHFVKTLTNLTDLGSDDGGTAVIAGSHKLVHIDPAVVIDAAANDPRMIHTVVAPAGSTLLFFEATIHSSGIIRSDNDRLFVIGGYTPTMFQPWEGFDPDPALLERASDDLRALLTGSKRFTSPQRSRALNQPAAV